MSELHKLSIIIPCLNEEEYIKECIMSLFNGEYPSDLLEFIVCDGG